MGSGGSGDLGDGSPLAGSRGKAQVGVWGLPQKLETNANFHLQRGTCTHAPLGNATDHATPVQKFHQNLFVAF